MKTDDEIRNYFKSFRDALLRTWMAETKKYFPFADPEDTDWAYQCSTQDAITATARWANLSEPEVFDIWISQA